MNKYIQPYFTNKETRIFSFYEFSQLYSYKHSRIYNFAA